MSAHATKKVLAPALENFDQVSVKHIAVTLPGGFFTVYSGPADLDDAAIIIKGEKASEEEARAIFNSPSFKRLTYKS